MPPRVFWFAIFVVTVSIGLMPMVANSLAFEEKEQPWKCHTIDNSSRGADGARLMDVNGDGLMDVATGWEEGGQVRVCLHPGHKKVKAPWPSVMVGKVASPEDAVFVDLDDDGAIDVVSCCEGRNNNVFIHWAPKKKSEYLKATAWETIPFPLTANMTQWMFAEPMPIDGQNGLDLVVGGKNKNGQIGWLQCPRNPRELNQWQYHPLAKAGWIMSLQKADMDNDGDWDILVSDRRSKESGCYWLENPGKDGKLFSPWPKHRIGPVGEEVMFLEYADADGDGLKDIIVPTFDRKLYFHKRNKGNPPTWTSRQLFFPKNTGSGKAVRVADINQDGKLDLVLCCANAEKGSGMVWITMSDLLSNNKDTKVHDITGLPGIKFDLIQLVDLDGDGDLDIINTEERSNRGGLGVVWYENPTK